MINERKKRMGNDTAKRGKDEIPEREARELVPVP